MSNSSGGYGVALAVPEFRALAMARLISVLGDSAAYLAVTVLVYQRTGSAFLASLTFATSFVPYLFGGVLLSALVDRLPPRRLIVGTDVLAALLVVVLVIPAIPILFVFVTLFAIGVMSPVRGACVDTLVAEILPGDSYAAGRSVQRIIVQGAQIFGIGAGGLLVAPLGPRGALVADTLSFLLSALIIAFGVRARATSGSPNTQTVMRDSLAGIRTVWAQPAVRRRLLLGWVVPFIGTAPEALGAPSVAAAGRPASAIALWLMAIPVGIIVGDLLAVWLVPPSWRVRLTWPWALTLPLVLCGFVFHPGFDVELALLVGSGFAAAYGLGLDQSLRDVTPEALRGRTFALNSTGLMATQGLGFASSGLIAEALSPWATVAVTAVVGLVVVLCLPLPVRQPSLTYQQ